MPVLQYRLSTRVSNGRAEVLCRFFSGHDFSQRAKCRIFCPVSAWDDKKQQLSIPKKITQETAKIVELQHKLDGLQDYIFNHWWDEQYSAYNGWLQKTIDDYMGISAKKERKRMVDVVAEYADYKNPSPRMRDQYEVIQRILDEYGKIHTTLYADEFSPEMVERVMEYYKTRPFVTKNKAKNICRSNNTLASKERILAAICSYAVRQGYMKRSPFGKREDGLYQVHEELYGDIFYLTKEERDHLASFQFSNPAHERIRDIFIFQCHVGCRVSDLLTLTSENIQDGFLQYIPIKTRGTSQKVVRVPLDETASGIINKYSGQDKLLPFVSDVAYNEYIHIITKEAGLNRKVILLKDGEQISKELWEVCTSHTARKTFSQNIFKHTKSEVVASSFTGHSPNTRVFARYAVVDDEMKKDIISEVQ